MKYVELSEQLKSDAPEVWHFFESSTDSLVPIFKMLEFQFGQYKTLVATLDARIEEAQAEKVATIPKLESYYEALVEENDLLQQELANLKLQTTEANDQGAACASHFTVSDMIVSPAVKRKSVGVHNHGMSDQKRTTSPSMGWAASIFSGKTPNASRKTKEPKSATFRRKVTDWLTSTT